MVFGIFKTAKEKRSTSTSVEEADVLYFGESDNNTRKSTIDALSERDLDTRIVRNQDIDFEEEEFEFEFDKEEEIDSEQLTEEIEDSYLEYKQSSVQLEEVEDSIKVKGTDLKAKIEGQYINDLEEEKKVVWRPKRILEEWETQEDVMEYGLLKQSDKLDFNYEPLNTPILNDKAQTKEVLRSHGLSTPETYDSVDEVSENHAIAKDIDGSQGDGFREIKQNEELEELDEDKIYEEFVNHYDNSSVDRRMFIVGDRIVSMGDRETNSDQVEAKNINNGGFYKKPESVSMEEINAGEEITDIFGEGIYALDYIRHEDGSIDILEVNDTPGTKLNSELDYGEDIFEEIASYVDDPSSYGDKPGVAEDIRQDLNQDVTKSESQPEYIEQELTATATDSNNKNAASV